MKTLRIPGIVPGLVPALLAAGAGLPCAPVGSKD